MQAMIFYTLITEITLHNSCILFDRKQSINPAYTQEEGIIQGVNTWSQASLNTMFKAVNHIRSLNKQRLPGSFYPFRKVQLQSEKRLEVWWVALCGRLKFPKKRTCLLWQWEKRQFCICFCFWTTANSLRLYQRKWALDLFHLKGYQNFSHES